MTADYSLSHKNQEYKDKFMANTGNIIAVQRDINPFSQTYGTTRTVTYQDLTRCPLPPTYDYKAKLIAAEGTAVDDLVPCKGTNTTLTNAEIGDNMRYYWQSVIVGYCTKIIGPNAFDGCVRLSDLTIKDSVETIDVWSFFNCTSLTSVELPESVTLIQRGAFNGCTSLRNINIPSGVNSILMQTFQGCTSLTSITIPANITGIGEYAFEGCASLTRITCLRTTPPTLVNVNAFLNTNANLKIFVPAQSLNDYKNASGWSNYASRLYPIPS